MAYGVVDYSCALLRSRHTIRHMVARFLAVLVGCTAAQRAGEHGRHPDAIVAVSVS